MAKITSLEELTSKRLRNLFFCYAVNRLEPGNHLFYFCVEQYHANPTIRKSAFIYDTFIKDCNADIEITGGNLSYEVLAPINLYNTEGVIDDVTVAVGQHKQVKTWRDKLKFRRWELIPRLAFPKRDLFDKLQAQVHILIKHDWFIGMSPFDTDNDIATDGSYSISIQNARRKLKEVGFDPDFMGVWG